MFMGCVELKRLILNIEVSNYSYKLIKVNVKRIVPTSGINNC